MVQLNVTRASHKRRLHENKINYSSKKAKVTLMKELVLQYDKLKSLNKVNNHSLFQSFYDEKKILFPWLKKETLRWHVRKSKTTSTNSTKATTTKAATTIPKPKLVSLVMKQSQVRT